tara:strand:+ start:197 stop:436 length:240 start_codon:yes stop_codon:yes gene_type:complete
MECPICLDSIIDVDKSVLKCNHMFHKECIDKWFKKSHRCPLCRDSLFNLSLSERENNYWKNLEKINKLIDSETSIVLRV